MKLHPENTSSDKDKNRANDHANNTDSSYTQENLKTETADLVVEKKKKTTDWPFYIGCAVTIVLLLIVTNFVARPVIVNGESMADTFHNGNYVIMWQLNYKPERRDVVVVDESNPLNERLFKRVVAVGGDHLEIKNGQLFINGEVQDEQYIKDKDWGMSTANLEVTLSEDEVFVMGDNRNNSMDSRSFGAVKQDLLMGKVVFRVFPFTQIGVVE